MKKLDLTGQRYGGPVPLNPPLPQSALGFWNQYLAGGAPGAERSSREQRTEGGRRCE